MYLVDTNVISEARKREKANRGVRRFFEKARSDEYSLFVSTWESNFSIPLNKTSASAA